MGQANLFGRQKCHFRKNCFALFWFSWWPSRPPAQFRADAQIVGATIAGTIHDATGATVNGATVTVRQTETGATRILVTGADGRYAAPSVPVGNYSVSVAHDGFQPQQQKGINLAVGQSVQVNFTLNVSSVHEEVVVDAGDPVVNTHFAANLRPD